RRTGRSCHWKPALPDSVPDRRPVVRCDVYHQSGCRCGNASVEGKNGGKALMQAGESIPVRPFRAARFDWQSLFGRGATGVATLLIVAILAVILGNIILHGAGSVSWRFVTTGTAADMFD